MAELAKPEGASASQSVEVSKSGGVSPLLALLIEMGVPMALVIAIAVLGASQRFGDIFSMVDNLPTDLGAAADPVENSLREYPNIAGSFVPTDASSTITRAELGSTRYRLGDTIYAGQQESVLGKPFMPLPTFYNVVNDDRVVFKRLAPAKPAAAARNGDGATSAESTIATRSEDLQRGRIRLVGYAEPNPKAPDMNPAAQSAIPPQSQMPRAKELPPSKAAVTMPPELLAPSVASSPSAVPNAKIPAKVAPAENPAAQAPLPEQVTTVTTPEIVTAATMTALLQADRREISSIAFVFIGAWSGLSDKEISDAVAAGVINLWDRLSSTREIFVIEDLDRVRRISIPPAAHLWSMLSTPLPLPGGNRLIEPQKIDFKTLPTNIDDLVNPIYRVTPESTRLPLIAFPLIGFFALLAGRRRYAHTERGVSVRGFVDGAALSAGLVVTLAVLWNFWRWFPESWFASASGLTGVALVAGALEGGLLTALRHAPRGPATEKDSALRTVLYRDTPVDDVARDRLGFGPMIEALRRFLDNPDTAPPVVLSVNGPWGSGKSSVMKMLARELEKTGRFRIVWFNAWQYHREEQILAAFLQTIARQLSADWGPVFALRLGWARWKDASLMRQLAAVGVLALVSAGLLHPDLRNSLADAASKAANGEYGSIATVFLGGGASIGTLGAVFWAAHVLWPFRLHFSKFFEVNDQSQRLGFIDEFTREFRLYREAVGNRKFLFLIDDLDRCQPDRIVDVLKAINLIITSADEAGRSFFILGYDQRYIVEAVEQHFVELAKTAHEPGERFGLQYLKKMITLSVSVPRPSAAQVQELLKRVDSEREPVAMGRQQDLTRAKRIRYAALRWIRRGWRVATDPTFARQAALGVVFVALALLLALPRSEQGAPSGQAPAATPSASATAAADIVGPTAGRRTIEMPKGDLPVEAYSDRIWWMMPGLILLAAGAALYVANRPMLAEWAYRREPQDSAKFVKAVDWCKELLPKNPRDAIRMINLMRMEYLVQESDKAPLEGRPLDEWECVSLTVLEKRHPMAFHRLLAALDDGGGRNGADTGKVGIERDAELEKDLAALKQAGGDISHIEITDKLKRFVDVNRFILEAEALPNGILQV